MQGGAMPTKRGPDSGQIEDHVKRISRRLIARRTQRHAGGNRDDHGAAAKLIQLQQQQDRMTVQQELERLDRYQASAAQLQAEAARQLRRRRATTKTSVTPDGKIRIEFRPVPQKFQPANYVWRLSTEILRRILNARWQLEHGQPPDRDLLAIERLRQRGNGTSNDARSSHCRQGTRRHARPRGSLEPFDQDTDGADLRARTRGRGEGLGAAG